MIILYMLLIIPIILLRPWTFFYNKYTDTHTCFVYRSCLYPLCTLKEYCYIINPDLKSHKVSLGQYMNQFKVMCAKLEPYVIKFNRSNKSLSLKVLRAITNGIIYSFMIS